MSEPRKIYVAERGEYSDYGVICAFESEEDARAANVGDDIMEMVLYPPGVQPVETHLGWTLNASVMKDGEVRDHAPAVRSTHHDWEVDTVPVPMPERPQVEAKDLTAHSYWNCWLITAKGRDLETVRKAMSDRIAHIRAEVMGL